MKARLLIWILVLLNSSLIYGRDKIHTWQKVEIELEAGNEYDNPCTEIEVWVQLEGPGFNRRCYGFWDGKNTGRIRLMATGPGTWTWTSGSNQENDGLNGKTGKFKSVEWTEDEKLENPLRREMIRPTSNGHAFEYGDGTPLFWLADTWWPCMTTRYFWYEDDGHGEVGTPEAGFIPFIETTRRDIGDYWQENFGWPESYARYIRYMCFRYQNLTRHHPWDQL
jgi:hypothetical protein